MDFIRNNQKYIVLGLLVCVTGIVWVSVFETRSREYVTISFLAVGEGNAALIQGRNGNKILIDGGPNREVLAPLAKAMPFFDRTLSAVIEMDSDRDNITGIPFVIGQYTTQSFFSSEDTDGSTAHTEIMRIVSEQKIPTQTLSDGMKIDLHDGSFMQAFMIDNTSILRYVYGNTCVLFAGNLIGKVETQFISTYGNSMACQVVSIAHHGAKTGTSDAFLLQMKPTYAILSNAKENRYAYPDQELIDRLQNHAVISLQTYEKGTITIQMDGKNIKIK